MAASVSRRDFLKLSGMAAISLAVKPFPYLNGSPFSWLQAYRLGRTTRSMYYYAEPSVNSKQLGSYNRDAIIRISEERLGDLKPVHNRIWLHTDEGWVHSSYVQPVRNILNEPVLEIPSGGFLGEVTVPYSQAWVVLESSWKRVYRFYYGSTYWVVDISKDSQGNYWYQVLDDLLDKSYMVQAEHLRQVLAEELTPLSPDVLDKRIEVDLERQEMTAFENGQAVLAARIASGKSDIGTPKGEFRVERKQPSRHMAVFSNMGDGFDLPGVPWVSFISWTGVSLHGTYWHNDFGEPQSHGCINLTPEAAKWVYRWTLPSVPTEKKFLASDQGTQVVVY